MKTSEVNADISECWASGLHPCEACCLLKIHIDDILEGYKVWNDSVSETNNKNGEIKMLTENEKSAPRGRASKISKTTKLQIARDLLLQLKDEFKIIELEYQVVKMDKDIEILEMGVEKVSMAVKQEFLKKNRHERDRLAKSREIAKLKVRRQEIVIEILERKNNPSKPIVIGVDLSTQEDKTGIAIINTSQNVAVRYEATSTSLKTV